MKDFTDILIPKLKNIILKLVIFVSKLKEVTVEYYNKCLKNQIIELKQKIKRYNIFNDIYEFVKYFSHKNNFSINFNDLSKKIQKNEISISEIINDIVGLLLISKLVLLFLSFQLFSPKNDDLIKIEKVDANEDTNESDINSQRNEKEEEIENLENKLNNIELEDEEPMDIYIKIQHKRKADTEEIFDSLYNKKSKKYKK